MVVNRLQTMGGRSGSGTMNRGTLENDTTYKGKIEEVESLVHMKDPEMYKATKEAISNFAAKLGIPMRNVKLAKLDGMVLGIGSQGGVFLNKGFFNQPAANMKKIMLKEYKSGHQTPTNKPMAHVVTHELAHAAWTSNNKSVKAQAAGKEIKALYKTWSKSGRKGYGTYAGSNVDEFWAEVSTKAAHGKADSYTEAVKKIYKKYNL